MFLGSGVVVDGDWRAAAVSVPKGHDETEDAEVTGFVDAWDVSDSDRGCSCTWSSDSVDVGLLVSIAAAVSFWDSDLECCDMCPPAPWSFIFPVFVHASPAGPVCLDLPVVSQEPGINKVVQ